jgi:hypothetical protein
VSRSERQRNERKWDVFICHASEDKERFVARFAEALRDMGVAVWYDDFTLEVGDSLSRSIDKGLAGSRYGVVVISRDFMRKGWPEYELRGLVTREVDGEKVILPVWLGVTKSDIAAYSPALADKVGAKGDPDRIGAALLPVLRVVRPDIHKQIARWLALRRALFSDKVSYVDPSELSRGPVVHQRLSDQVLVRIKMVHHALGTLLKQSLSDLVDSFMRDINLNEELMIWEKMAATYLDIVRELQMDADQQAEVLAILLSATFPGKVLPQGLKRFTREQAAQIRERYFSVVPAIPRADEEPRSTDAA